MADLEWRFDRTTSRGHEVLEAVVFASFGGASLLLGYAIAVLGLRAIVGEVRWLDALVAAALLGAGLAVAHMTDGSTDRSDDAFGLRRLVAVTVLGACALAAVATVSFEAMLLGFVGTFVPAGLVRGTCRSTGSVDLDSGRVNVDGRRTRVRDVEAVRTVPLRVATVVWFSQRPDAEEPLRAPFVVSPGTARELASILDG